jgi:Taurine catabolism dioxygenase TauD, TfdA family
VQSATVRARFRLTWSIALGQRYDGVVVRLLDSAERRVQISETETPLVIAPRQSSSPQFLREFLSSNSTQLSEDIARHGAILLRGFNVDSVAEFERQVLSIRSMRGMRDIMLSEPGRTRVSGAEYVLHTNTLYKTGGTFRFGGFHNENYYGPDVPRYISFFCIKPSWLGGETGLLNTARLFEDLPTVLQQKLEEQSYVVNQMPIATIAEREGLSEEDFERFCVSAGLPVISSGGTKRMVIFKPSVVRHPVTGERSLMINLSGALSSKGLHRLQIDAFLPDYCGWRWLIHRLCWKFPWIPRFASPANVRRFLSLTLRRKFSKVRANAVLPSGDLPLPRVGSAFTPEDVKLVASAMRRRYSSFLWKRGDILIVDNLKMAHTGMPGLGHRELRVLLCNPVVLDYSRDALGLQLLANDMEQSLGEQLLVLKNTVEPTAAATGSEATIAQSVHSSTA